MAQKAVANALLIYAIFAVALEAPALATLRITRPHHVPGPSP